MIGQVVKFTDENRVTHDALVTFVHGDPSTPEKCLINLVHVEADESKFDNYGRQMARRTSICPSGQYDSIFGWAPVESE